MIFDYAGFYRTWHRADKHRSGMMQPLNEQEQQALIALFQAFLQVPHAEMLQLRLYADTGGSLYREGKHAGEERIVLSWLDVQEGAEQMAAYARQETENDDDPTN